MNCMIVDDDEMSRKTLHHLISLSEDLELEDTCNNAIEAMSLLNSKKIDLLLLDVEMPGISGPQLLKSIHKPPLVIVISGKKEYEKQALQLNIVDYLVKPVDPELFLKSIAKAKGLCDEAKNEVQFSGKGYITILDKHHPLKLNVVDILFFEAKDDCITIITADKKYTVCSTIDLLENKLDKQLFIRINRTCIVNIQHISVTEENTVILNDQLIPIAQEYKQDFSKRLNLLK